MRTTLATSAACFAGLLAFSLTFGHDRKPSVGHLAPPTTPESQPALTDDDPLPEGAIARLGTTRYRGSAFWTHAELSTDCKSVLLTDHGGASLVDLATGKMKQRFPTNLKQLYSPPRRMRLCGNVVLGQNDHGFIMWDATTGKVLHEYSGKPFEKDKRREIISLCASDDGSVVVISSQGEPDPNRQGVRNGSVCVLTYGEKPTVREFWTGTIGPPGLGLTPDGKTLVACGALQDPDKDNAECDIHIWDVTTGKLRHRVESKCNAAGIAGFSADGTKMLVTERFAHGLIWDVTTGKRVSKLEYHHPDNPDDRFRSWWTLSSDGKTAACLYPDRSVQVWDVATGKKTKHHPPIKLPLVSKFPEPLEAWGECARYSPDGRLIAVGAFGSNIVFAWDVGQGKLLTPIAGFAGDIHKVAFAEDGRSLFASGSNHTLWRWSLGSRPVAANIDLEFDMEKIFPSYGHVPWAFSPDGKSVAVPHYESGNTEKRFVVFSLTDGKERYRSEVLAKSEVAATDLVPVYSPDGKWIACGRMYATAAFKEKSGPLFVAHADTGKRREGIKLDALPDTECAFSPDSKYLIVTGLRFDRGKSQFVRQITGWDMAGDKPLASTDFPATESPWTSTSLVVAPDGKTALLLKHTEQDEVVLVGWDVVGGKLMKERTAPLSRSTSQLAVAPRTGLIALAGKDTTGSPVIWVASWADLKESKVFRGHRQEVSTLAFSPDGKTLASGSHDTTVLLWNVESIRP